MTAPSVTRVAKPRKAKDPASPGPIEAEAYHAGSYAMIPLAAIDVGPNVRTEPGELDGLGASIRERGVLQPIKVRAVGDRWLVVWGQRRFLAARQVGLERIPAIVTTEEPSPADLAMEQLVGRELPPEQRRADGPRVKDPIYEPDR